MSTIQREPAAVTGDESSDVAAPREAWRELDQRLRRKSSIGSVEGFIERMPTDDAEPCFAISARLTGARVACCDKDGVLAASGARLGDRVRVGGRIDRDDDGRPVAIAVARIYRYPPDDDLPTVSEMRGIFPDLTEGMDATEWVKLRRRGRRYAKPLS